MPKQAGRVPVTALVEPARPARVWARTRFADRSKGHRLAVVGVFVTVVVVLLVLLALGLLLARRWAAELQRRQEVSAEVDSSTLEFRVAEHEDPALVIAALEEDGYVVSVDPDDPRLLRVHERTGTDRGRERVRAVIEGSISGPARFEDEV